MLVCCWAVKGGVGTTVVAAGLGVSAARRDPTVEVLLVDLAGDLPCALGLPEPEGPGLAEWLAAGPGAAPDALGRLEVAAAPGLRLLPRGAGPLAGERADVLAALLAGDPRRVVVDAGRLGEGTHAGVARLGVALAAGAAQSLVVTRACVLGLRRLLLPPVRATGVVVVRDPGRSLGAAEVASASGLPVVAEVAVDPAVSRAVDAGLVFARLPRSFATALAAVD